MIKYFQRLLSLGLWLIFVLLSYVFSMTNGLAYIDDDSKKGIAYVKNLMSSGSDDNVVITFGMFLGLLPVVVNLIRWNKDVGYITISISLIIVLGQGVFLSAIEVGSIGATVIVDGNIVLLSWLIVLMLIFVQCSYLLYRRIAYG